MNDNLEYLKPGAHFASCRQLNTLESVLFRWFSRCEPFPGTSVVLQCVLTFLTAYRKGAAQWLWSVSGTSWRHWVVYFLRIRSFPVGWKVWPPCKKSCCFTYPLTSCVLRSFPSRWKVLIRGNCHAVMLILSCTASSRSAWATRDPGSKKQTTTKSLFQSTP